MTEEARRQAGDAIRYYAELNRRVSAGGIDGISGLLQLHEQLARALAGVSAEELEWVLAEIKDLLDQIIKIDSELRRLQVIKAAMKAGRESGESQFKGVE